MAKKSTKKKIIITASDQRRLEELLASDYTRWIGDKPYLHDLRAELESAKVVSEDQVPPDVVTMNSTVRLRDLEDGETETYTLVYPEHANIADGRLSILAPIGTAILGYRVGDIVEWHVPSGTVRMCIEEILFQPEREKMTA